MKKKNSKIAFEVVPTFYCAIFPFLANFTRLVFGDKYFFSLFEFSRPFWAEWNWIKLLYMNTLHTHLCVYPDPLPTTENNFFEQKVCTNSKQKLLSWCISFELTTAVSTEHSQECIEDARKSAAIANKKTRILGSENTEIFFVLFSRVSELRFNSLKMFEFFLENCSNHILTI